jgi:hypothetical protein
MNTLALFYFFSAFANVTRLLCISSLEYGRMNPPEAIHLSNFAALFELMAM